MILKNRLLNKENGREKHGTGYLPTRCKKVLKEAIEYNEKLFKNVYINKISYTKRILLSVPNEGITFFKQAYFEENNNNNKDNVRVLGCKIVSVRAKNSNLELPLYLVPLSYLMYKLVLQKV